MSTNLFTNGVHSTAQSGYSDDDDGFGDSGSNWSEPHVQRNHAIDIAARFNAIERRFDSVDAQLLNISKKLEASILEHRAMYFNTIARVQNGFATTSLSRLVPLTSFNTGGAIPNFPQCAADIGALTVDELKAILQEVGHVAPGNTIQGIDYLRYALRVQLGLRGSTVHDDGGPGDSSNSE